MDGNDVCLVWNQELHHPSAFGKYLPFSLQLTFCNIFAAGPQNNLSLIPLCPGWAYYHNHRVSRLLPVQMCTFSLVVLHHPQPLPLYFARDVSQIWPQDFLRNVLEGNRVCILSPTPFSTRRSVNTMVLMNGSATTSGVFLICRPLSIPLNLIRRRTGKFTCSMTITSLMAPVRFLHRIVRAFICYSFIIFDC